MSIAGKTEHHRARWFGIWLKIYFFLRCNHENEKFESWAESDQDRPTNTNRPSTDSKNRTQEFDMYTYSCYYINLSLARIERSSFGVVSLDR